MIFDAAAAAAICRFIFTRCYAARYYAAFCLYARYAIAATMMLPLFSDDFTADAASLLLLPPLMIRRAYRR